MPRRSLQIMSESEEEVGIRSPFGGSVTSDNRELAIDEGSPESSVVPNLQFVPDSNVVIREGEECVRRALEEVEASDSWTEGAVKEMALLTSWAAWTKRLEVNQKGSHLLTFCDVRIRCQKLYWRAWSVILICHCVSRHSSFSFSISFVE